MKGPPDDPRGVIAEAYRIDGIGPADCRTIFLDWALSLPESRPQAAAVRNLLARYEADAPDHPMTEVLRQAAVMPTVTGRRGGRRGRGGGD